LASEPQRPCDPVDPALEAQYNLRIRHPERSAIYAGMTARSAAWRARAPGFVELTYADEPACRLEFYPAQGVSGPAPLLFFIHGGYWRALEPGIFSYLAEAWTQRGVHVALPGYTLAPKARVERIVDEVAAALEYLRDRAQHFGIDTTRIVVSGHSAGGQLGACILAAGNWHAAGFLGISGVYDLEPLLATTVNHDVHFDAASARTLSPLRRAAVPGVRYVCAVGGGETDGFRGQSRNYVASLQRQGVSARYLEVTGRNHFDVLDDLADPTHPLFQATFGLFELATT